VRSSGGGHEARERTFVFLPSNTNFGAGSSAAPAREAEVLPWPPWRAAHPHPTPSSTSSVSLQLPSRKHGRHGPPRRSRRCARRRPCSRVNLPADPAELSRPRRPQRSSRRTCRSCRTSSSATRPATATSLCSSGTTTSRCAGCSSSTRTRRAPASARSSPLFPRFRPHPSLGLEARARAHTVQPAADPRCHLPPPSLLQQLCQSYPKETKEFPSHLSALLLEHHNTLSPDTRKSIVQNLVMLRNKEVIPSIECVASCLCCLPSSRQN
jgi:hypothetical protein